MYSKNAFLDPACFAKANMSELLARCFATASRMCLTQQAGRGAGGHSVEKLADCFWRCFEDGCLQGDRDAPSFHAFGRGSIDDGAPSQAFSIPTAAEAIA